MGLEVCRGKVSSLAKPEQDSRTECKIGESRVQLHPDLERHIAEGDEVIVAGNPGDTGIAAMAVHNVSQKKVSYVDASNYVLGIGFGGFIALCGFVLGGQYWMGGNMTLTYANALMSVTGLVVMSWAIARVLMIKKAAKKVHFAH